MSRKYRIGTLVLTFALLLTMLVSNFSVNAAALPPTSSSSHNLNSQPADRSKVEPATGVNREKLQQTTVEGVDCATWVERGVLKQTNFHADKIAIACGLSQGGSASKPAASGQPDLIGGTDVNLVTGGESLPHVIQAETFLAANGNTIVATYNDSVGAPNGYSGVSYSTDGGATFTRILPSPFNSGLGTNFGDPTVVWNARLGRFYSIWLATGCGGQGLGVWSSPDGSTWTVGVCAHSGGSDDRHTMWADNNSASPFYGRMYLSWNNFAVGGGALQIITSDNGTNWTAPVTVNSGSFRRNVQLTGSPGTDGTAFLASMDEGGGGLSPRTNYMYRSTDGGANWLAILVNGPFPAGGDSTCGYFATFNATASGATWRHMGWGQPAVGPANTVHYLFTQRGNGGDTGDIYYVRSTDNGSTWAAPVRLNTDGGQRTQWQPSLVALADGRLLASWYDQRNTANADYQYYGRISTDGGLTWQADDAISDQVISAPGQPDPNINGCFYGDYNYNFAQNGNAYVAWTDGRVLVGGTRQQDSFFDKIALGGNATPTVGPSPTNTPTNTPVPPSPTPNPCNQSLRILIVYSDVDLPNTLRGQLLAEPGVTTVDLFDAQAAAPSLAQLLNYDEVIFFSNYPFGDPETLGNNLADYQDRGGVTFGLAFGHYFDPYAVGGRYVSGGYSPFNVDGGTSFNTSSIGTVFVPNPWFVGVSNASAYYRTNNMVAAGATLIANWDDQTPMMAVKGKAAAITAYLGDSPANFSGDFARLIVNAGRALGNNNCTTPTPTPCVGSNGNWRFVAPLPIDSFGPGVDSDGRSAYSIAGYSFSFGPLVNSYRYDPGANTWTTIADLPEARYDGVAVYVPSTNRIHYIGGVDAGGNVVQTHYFYDINSNTWREAAPLPDSRQQMGTGYIDGKIYVVGGFSSNFVGSETSTNFVYDVASDTWGRAADLPIALAGPASEVLSERRLQRLYIAGGRNSASTSLTTNYAYDPSSDTWTARASLPGGVNFPGSGVLGREMYVYGGGDPFLSSDGKSVNPTAGDKPQAGIATGGSDSFVSTYIYNSSSDTWRAGPNLNQDRSFLGGTSIGNRYLLAVGGYSGSQGSSLASVEVLEQAGCATATPINPTPTTVPCRNLRILIVYSDVDVPNTLRGQLLAQSGVIGVDLFDAQADTPSLAQLLNYNEVVFFSNLPFGDPETLGNNLADYQDRGGVTFGLAFAHYSAPYPVGGRYVSGGYSPFNIDGGASFSNASLGTIITASPLLDGVSGATAYYRTNNTVAAGATLIANWTDDTPMLAEKGRAAAITAYLGDGPANFSGDFARIIVNAGRSLSGAVCGVPQTPLPTRTPSPSIPPPTATKSNH